MSDQRTSSGAGEITPAGARNTTDVVRLDEGHHVGTGGLPARFENPGLPPHVERLADRDPEAGRRAERQVATMFGLSMLATLVFLVGYFAIDYTRGVYLPGIGHTNLLNVVLGVSMGVSLFLIGAGAVHWAKTLMPDEEVAEERHPMRSDDASRAKAVDVIVGGGEAAQLGRRPILKYSLVGALGLFALPFVVQVVGSLGNPTVAPEELVPHNLGRQARSGQPAGPALPRSPNDTYQGIRRHYRVGLPHLARDPSEVNARPGGQGQGSCHPDAA